MMYLGFLDRPEEETRKPPGAVVIPGGGEHVHACVQDTCTEENQGQAGAGAPAYY